MIYSIKTIAKAADKAIAALLKARARRATVFVSERQTVQVTRTTWRRKKSTASRRFDLRDSRVQLNVTFGTPNCAARAFIKKAKKAGEPFPIKKAQLNFLRAR